MTSKDSLDKIHHLWISQIAQTLAQSEDLRPDFEELLEQFFARLLQSVNSHDPTLMEGLLRDWVLARTQTDLEARKTSLPAILNQIHQLTFAIARDNLPEPDAFTLIDDLLPIFLHCFEFAAQLEIEKNIEHISQQLEFANKNLQRLDKSKSDFIAIAAHELKTPLTLIEGYSSMVREVILQGREQVQPEVLLNGIENGANRLRQIIDDMIDVSMIDNNLLSLNLQPMWFNRLFLVLKDEFEGVINERGMQLDIRDFSGCEEMIFADNERLYQAFRNLFTNAIKFTPDGGKITVDGRKLSGFIEITISDTGIGIDPKDHSVIFEKFGRVGNTSLHSSGKTKFKGGGPGLGLSITRGIIEAHGGSVWIESPGYNETEYPGSTFHVLLPIRTTPHDPKLAKLFVPSEDQDTDPLAGNIEPL
ncbi:MAG: hypothetical protein B6D39_11070 [Anaerolineae bacterium UTCFX2]|jgi:signal transduction histidine kinase|nr:HAMP domain-containing histidine kinase [Anaerolineae bacterium]MCZ7553916.1 HAMP domain-containing histidine kinase [Anaerolineales bacterium]OQY88818.1 MAG: hypothetical protein B6D39_11070 [Anaerolineae bacterium UTCFX2]